MTETSRYRMSRYWVGGDREGEFERFATNLPGYPDDVEAAGDGTYWLAIPTPRDGTLETLHARPGLKRLLGTLPRAALEQVSWDPYGLCCGWTKVAVSSTVSTTPTAVSSA